MKHCHKLLFIYADHQKYLPEPASLQEGERAAKQLQEDVTSVENLQEGDKSVTKDGIKEELMHSDVQHTSAVEVIEEKKSCQKRELFINWKKTLDLINLSNCNMHTFLVFYPLIIMHPCNSWAD